MTERLRQRTSGDIAVVVIRAQQGDAAALNALLERCQAFALALAIGSVGDPDLARDVAQESLLDAYLHLGDLREPGAFLPWLRRIVAKQADRLRRRRHPDASAWAAAEQVPDAAADPAAVLTRQAEAAQVRSAVEQLPPGQRVIVALQYLGGYTQAEIAAQLDLSLATVKKRAHMARQRLKGDLAMVEATFRQQGQQNVERLSATVQLFLAIHRGDAAAVAELMRGQPELANAPEAWSADEAHQAPLPYARAGTPLIRAAERGERSIVQLLLAAGADVNGVCGCEAGETPLWAAAVADQPSVVGDLLVRGADPNAPGPLGHTVLHVAAMRNWPDLAHQVLAAGADRHRTDAAGRTALDWAELQGHAAVAAALRGATTPRAADPSAPPAPELDGASGLCETGIKALDLFAPFRHGDIVLADGDLGLGLVVLIGELSMALRDRGYGDVLWTGFAQPVLNGRQLEHTLGESGRRALAQLALVPEHAEAGAAQAAFWRTVNRWRQAARQGRQLLVVFEAAGHRLDVEALLPRLRRRSPPTMTALLVAPEVFPARGTEQCELPPGVTARIAFDPQRARQGLYPALDLTRSTSARLTASVVGAEHVAVAAAARDLLTAYRTLDPDLHLSPPDRWPAEQQQTVRRAQRLHAFLTQPFVFAEPFTGRRGVRVPLAHTLAGVRSILAGEVDAVPLEQLRYLGGLSVS